MKEEIQKFIPYGRQSVNEDDVAKVIEVLKSPYLTQGPVGLSFEREIAHKTESDYCVSFNSATSALHMACLSLGLGKGDWLWTSPITFVASANCGLYCGAKVDFVDINLSNGLIDITKLSNKLDEAKMLGKLPKIIIPVHLGGSSCEMLEIKKLSEKYGFFIVEDASHALGGEYKNLPVGSCQFSSICVFSCHPVKIITTGEGGFATTNDPKLYEVMKELRSHGITKNKEKFLNQNKESWRYEQQKLGYNYRLSDIQSALGLSQLKRLKKIIEERTNLFLRYQKLLDDLPITLLKVPKDVKSSFHLGIARLLDSDPKRHEKIFDNMRSHKIGVQVHYIPVHTQPYYQQFGFREGDFPNAEIYSKSVFSLPLFPGLSSQDQNYVVDKLKESIEL